MTTAAEVEGDRIPTAIALRLLSAAVFAVMNALIKLAEQAGAGIGEIVFWRQAGAALLITGVIAAGPGLATIRTERFAAHVLRAAVGLVAMGFTFHAILVLPLAEATTIGFTIPVFATILGAVVLREPTGRHRWAAVLAGFAGVLIVTAPGFGRGGSEVPLTGALSGLAGAFCTANVSILLRRMGRSERPQTVVFWFSVLSLPPLGIGYAFVAQPHPPLAWAMLLGVGLLGGLAQLAMTGSLKLGPVSLVVPMDYFSLIWAILLGWWLFAALPGATTWFGAPVIIASGLYIIWRERVVRRRETLQALA